VLVHDSDGTREKRVEVYVNERVNGYVSKIIEGNLK